MAEQEPTKRVLTAAEKRAARRARVLQDSEGRLQLLKGQIASLKTPSDEHAALEQQLDEGVDELLSSNPEASGTPTESSELKIPSRVDPAQRRRDAAARRRKKEQMVEEMLEPKTPKQEIPEIGALSTESANETTFSRHSTALKLHVLEEKLVLLLLVAAAVYVAACMDLRAITASLAADDQLFVSYQDLIAQGVPMESIRQQFEREQVEPEMRSRLERLLTQQLKTEALGTSTAASGWLPDVADLGFFFTSLVAHPPIVLCVLLVRLLVSAASLTADDQLFVSYQDLIAQGVPMESIRQQFEREQVEPEMRSRLERLLTQQLKTEALGTSTAASGWLPDVADLGFFFTSLVAHPPIVLCVLLVRLLVSTGAKALHKVLDLPDVKNPQEGDLGFLANMALSEFLVKGRKSLDDVFVFIFALVVFVAIRAIWIS
ncbi:Transmembrane protein [Phytophthora megakarya]|uniref:Transmembrane protein n=1 Tax=Phytophthora megakarya TaxID=4795 RepID=A0A225V9N6_9STRA|nr:Transmembrane protein [Phytophthora megakarya]